MATAAPEERVGAFGAVYWATNAGFTVAMALGGWRPVSGGAGCSRSRRSPTRCSRSSPGGGCRRRGPSRTPPRREAGAAGFGAALRDPLLLAVTGLHLCFGLLIMQSASTLPLAMTLDGLGPGAIGAVMAISGFVVVVGQPLAARPLARPARGLSLASGRLLSGLGFASTAWTRASPASR